MGLAALVAIGISTIIVRKLEKSSEYKYPKGKYRNRYK